MEDEFLTVAEIAEQLKVNPQTVRNWVDWGALPVFRVGARAVRISRRDFDAFMGRRACDDASPGPLPAANEDGDVRDWATFGLGSQLDADSDAIRAALAARLHGQSGDAAGEALLGLVRRHDPRALSPLLSSLQTDPGNLIVEAAAELGAREALPVLLQLKAQGWGDDADRALLDQAIAACGPNGSEGDRKLG